jgi:hypothetical protein
MAYTMSFWDYILTLRMEVDLVWKSKWNFMKGLYFFQRYSTFIVTICVILYRQSYVFSIFLCSLFCRSNGEVFEGGRVSEGVIRCWRFVNLTLH